MPKINVYLPDELAEAVRGAHIPVSAVCQAALERAVRDVTSLREERPGPAGEERWPLGITAAFARYTGRARRAVALAQHDAIALGHGFVGTEHLLLGILDEGDNLALRVLAALDVAPDDIRQEIQGHVRRGDAVGGQLPLTPLAKKALELAGTESVTLGHNYIGCEHLLLGLVAEVEGMAGSVLRQMGVELRIARRAVATALAGFVHARANEASAPADRLDEILRRLDAIEQRLAS